MPRNPQGLYTLPPGNPVVSGTIIESNWANTTMSDLGDAITGSLPRNGSAPMTAPLILPDQTANPPLNDKEAISLGYLNERVEAIQTGASGGPGNPLVFENDRFATQNYTITNGKNAMSAGPVGINPGVTIGVPAGSVWSIVGGSATSGPDIALGTALPIMDGIASAGNSLFASHDNHVHPSDTSRAALNSPAFTGIPTAPTAPLATNTEQIATTAFVATAVLTGKYAAVAALNINCALANVFSKTISGATVITVSNVAASGNVTSFMLELTNGGSGTITWWAGVKWASGAVPAFTVAGTDILEFYTRDGGTTWRGSLLVKDSR